MNKKLEAILIASIFLFCIYVWSLPIQENPMPFGDVDSSVHFTSGDWMAQNDRSMFKLPYYMDYVLGTDAKGKLVYPPQFNTNEAIAQIIGGDRFKSVFIFIAILSSLSILSAYLLVRHLFGVYPALLSSFMMVFSARDYMYYLWGLWPQVISFTYTPVVIYSFYRYLNREEKKDRKYLILTSILAAIQALFHPQGAILSIGVIGIYTAVISIKERRLALNIKHFIIIASLFILFIAIFAPFQVRMMYTKIAGNLATEGGDEDSGSFLKNPGRLLYWSKAPETLPGVPGSFYSYEHTYKGYWTLPILILGLIVIFTRRRKEDWFVISWLVALYLFIHFDVFGFTRAERFLQTEAQIFTLVIAVGLLAIPSIINSAIKIPKTYLKYFRYILIIIFLILVINTQAKPAIGALRSSYLGLSRITPYQYEAAQWLTKNVPEDADILYVGSSWNAKQKWMRGIAFRNILYGGYGHKKYFAFMPDPELMEDADYVLIDFSDWILSGNSDKVNQLIEYEKEYLGNLTLLYDQKENIANQQLSLIKVYKIE